MRLKKYLMILIMTTILLLTMVSCEIGAEFVGAEMGKFPDKIVYFVGSDFEIDMIGATVIFLYRDGKKSEQVVEKYENFIVNHMVEMKLVKNDYFIVDHNVDFSIPGVYEVKIIFMVASKEYIFRFPVVVIDPEAIDPSSF